MKIAILMTCHNRRETTLRCLRGLPSDVDVYLVDDGSTDGTREEVGELSGNGSGSGSGSGSGRGSVRGSGSGSGRIRLIEGDGTLFWAKGMELAWRTALEEEKLHGSTPTQNSNFIFTGSLDDNAKWQAYARADLFVLPTYSENFGIVIAEALWAGVPVITTKGTPWSELVGVPSSSGRKESDDHSPTQDSNLRCGWWIDLPEGDGLAKWDALDEALKEATDLDSPTPTQDSNSLKKMGANGHRLVEQKYTWKAVVGAMKHGYEQILNPCEHAPCDNCRNYGDTCQMK